MGKADRYDRLVQGLLALVALITVANGSVMLVDPLYWYFIVPTVRFTGFPNEHFIRDIGMVYLFVGGLLTSSALYPYGRWKAAALAAFWLTMHAAVHLYEVLAGICSPSVFLADIPGVFGPPALVWIALTILFVRRRIAPGGLPKFLLLPILKANSPQESAYLKEIGKAPGHAFEKLAHFMPMTMHRHDAPQNLFHMARIGATLVEDCGPCALTAAQGALDDGVTREIVNAALAAKPPEGELRTAFDFGQAVALHSDTANQLGEVIESRFGRSTRLELAMTAATVRSYPAMKRGFGLAQTCAVKPLSI